MPLKSNQTKRNLANLQVDEYIIILPAEKAILP